MENKPLVSVVIPAYRTGRVIGQCIKSITRQSYGNIEVIVVNDCSPDNTLSVVTGWQQKDSRISVIDSKKRGG